MKCTHRVGALKTTARMKLRRTGTVVARAAGDGGAPACYGGGRARGRLKLEDIAEGVAGLVLDSDDGPVSMVEEVISDFGEHGSGGIHADCCPRLAKQRGDETAGNASPEGEGGGGRERDDG